jgi:hypothetical protein
MEKLEVTLEEFYLIIGELEVIKRKQGAQIIGLLRQVDEMATEISRLREENGRLAEPKDHE